MEEVTDTVFRQMVVRFSRPEVFFTEFTSTEGLCSAGRDAVIHRFRHQPEEHPLVAQIWGNDPEHYLKCAKLLHELGFDGVDINMGCPVLKIIKQDTCSALIEKPALARELILAAKEGAGPLPVSVKTRIGFRKKNTEEWIGFLLEQDLAALTVHGRVAKQLYRYPADWAEIKKAVELRDTLKKPTLIIGNGDVRSRSEALQRANAAGVDGVMIGRAIMQNPLLFRVGPAASEFKDLRQSEKIGFYLEHIDLFAKTWKDERQFGVLKKFGKVYLQSFRGASELRQNLMQAKSLPELRNAVAAAWDLAKEGAAKVEQ